MRPVRAHRQRTVHTGQCPRRYRRAGVSLLELIAASTILAMTLVPSLRLMRDSLKVSRQLEVRECLTTTAMGALEHQAQQVAAKWQMTSGTDRSYGQLAGYPQVVVDFETSDSPLRGGIKDSLAVVSVSAFDDQNSNGRHDGSESAVRFATKVARLQSYSLEGSGL
jgi:type II secretory pathway component PulJ